MKCNQRTCAVCSKLVKEVVLKEVNLAVGLATQELSLPEINILVMANNLPLKALSDLESDPEDTTSQTTLEYQQKAHVDGIEGVKWMSQLKVWTSEAVSQDSSL